MRLSRLVALLVAMLAAVVVPAAGGANPSEYETGFEEREGASWTTHEEELAFLDALAQSSSRVEIDVLGTTPEGRPLQLVRIGDPAPRAPSGDELVMLLVCTQHGNEPAGRETCLQTIRELATSEDPTLVDQLQRQTVLVVPTANPDGRAADTRGNSDGVDVNRDHLPLATIEAQLVAAVVRDWQPTMVLDLHEYGPSQPLLYDSDVLYLWPRNLNVDPAIRELARSYAVDHLDPCVVDAGFTAGVYGIQSLTGQVDLAQTAGGGDEGIARNAMGLRHSLGILIESAVSPRLTSTEPLDAAGTARRRVASQVAVLDCTFAWLRQHEDAALAATHAAPQRAAEAGRDRSLPLYLSGQDEDTTLTGTGDAEVVVDPPPCAYDLTPAQVTEVADVLDLHGIDRHVLTAGGARVPLGQPARAVVALLLDGRASRNVVDGTPVEVCAAGVLDEAPPPAPDPTSQDPRTGPLPATGGGAVLPVLAVLAAGALRRRR